MSKNIYALAQKIKQGTQIGDAGGYQLGKIAQLTPKIKVSAYDGEVMLEDGVQLLLTETVRKKDLHVGDTVALIGARVFLAIDRIV